MSRRLLEQTQGSTARGEPQASVSPEIQKKTKKTPQCSDDWKSPPRLEGEDNIK